ncbi:efflux RND transporter periplasmic adaptor subunit [Pseudoalteromonas sp. S2755]|uniref:efflux RND transporter periplasmic adaptor subunit n=1 Tax=Pseudoalteromonas sp. S2755 TaxID=2066523 RepID=UPI00110B20E3|nr:efflux RND transporter periplasmic adaptor subunit [Pseudoalteromonas sp. S2755]TMN33692.1 efflux transporter periplasmic adaptor subunit [Pseudoalteromonas sp. S2755]
MNNNLKMTLVVVTTLTAGVLVGTNLSSSNESTVAQNAEKAPLYWVAPMDPNYRRDKPGKSPMGMDLVPVYEEESANAKFGEGVVEIAPHVENNLGVRTAVAMRQAMSQQIRTVGYVQYNEDSLVHIHPRVEGWVEKLYVKAAGDPVKQGEPLYTLYSPQLVNAQEEYLIARKRNNQALINAAHERLKALHLSDDFIDTLKKTGEVHQSITFYARQSGVLDGLQIREGFYVKPGTTLMSIAKLDEIWVEADVFERDATLVAQGQAVSMRLDFLPGRMWRGQVDYVYPSLNEKTRTLRVRLRFDNSDALLKPNMFAQVNIQADSRDNVLQVPSESVIRTAKQNRVVVEVAPGSFKSVVVELGQIGDENIEILNGLNEGDKIVTSAQFLIDSQSSITSDFMRMAPVAEAKSVWIEGEIQSVNDQSRVVNIDHQPVPEWEWPEMVMDFTVADSVNVDELNAGQTLHFEATKQDDGSVLLTGIHIMSEGNTTENTLPTATVGGVINAINPDTRVLNISRDAIEKWDRPATTMDFVAAEHIDLSQLMTGMKVTFTFEVGDEFVVTDIKPADEMSVNMHSGH